MKRSGFKRKAAKRKPTVIRTHWSNVAALGCIVCGYRHATIHHVHGGSMRGVISRGVGQKTSDWSVIPLCRDHHTGNNGVDRIGVETWETRFGSQLTHLMRVFQLLDGARKLSTEPESGRV